MYTYATSYVDLARTMIIDVRTIHSISGRAGLQRSACTHDVTLQGTQNVAPDGYAACHRRRLAELCHCLCSADAQAAGTCPAHRIPPVGELHSQSSWYGTAAGPASPSRWYSDGGRHHCPARSPRSLSALELCISAALSTWVSHQKHLWLSIIIQQPLWSGSHAALAPL